MSKKCVINRSISLLLLATLISTLIPINSMAKETINSDRVIVSLGDSYSSGEGIEPFYGQEKKLEEKVKDYDWLAHRSENAWSGMLTLSGVEGTMAENRNEHWYFAAASGAKVKHLEGKQEKKYRKQTVKYAGHYRKWLWDKEELPKQLSVFEKLKDKKADYVTITMGGNDADFATIIEKAALGTTYLCLSGLSDQLEDVWEKFEEPNGIKDSLDKAYRKISKTAGKQAHIIVVGYPKLLDQTGEGFLISFEEAKMINEAVSEFNIEIYNIVKACESDIKISFVPVEDKFNTHEAYSEDPYIHEIIFNTQEEDINDYDIKSAYSMHPNYEGACKYAECVQEEINRLEELYGYSDYYKVNEEDYFEFLAKHPEYNYYAFLDVNNDGNIEMLAAKELYDTGEMLASYYSYIDLFAYKNGKIDRVHEDIWTKFFNLMYDEENNWIVTTIDGPNGAGYEIISLDSKCDTRVQRIERYDYDIDEAGSKSVQLYYNDEEVKPEKQAKYEELWGKIQNGSSEEISFESVFENTNSSLNKSNSVEEQVKEIKQIYNEIQNNLDSYIVEDGGGGTTRYVENGEIRKIVTGLHTYDDWYNENLVGYTAEYYYKDDEVVYVVVHNDYDIYRYYLEKGDYTNCIRYIDEYGTVYDYSDGIPSYEVNDLGEFCTLAMQELHWAGVF